MTSLCLQNTDHQEKAGVEQVFQALTRIIQLGGPDSVYVLGIVLHI